MSFYRLLIAAAALPLVAICLWRCLRGKDSAVNLLARLGFGPSPARKGPTIWVHAASNGELASAKPVIRALLDADATRQVLITCNTDTGRKLALGWGWRRLSAQVAPVDFTWIARRMIRKWDMCGHVIVESEFWPNRMAAFAAQNLPVVVVGARLSASTFARWQKLPKLAGQALGFVRFLSAQDTQSGGRFAALGLPDDRFGPTFPLKALYAPDRRRQIPDFLQGHFDRNQTWLAASTHPGEEADILRAHLRALQSRPDLKLILAPRHPARVDEVSDLMGSMGIRATRFSARQTPNPQDVLLVDTMGDMDLFYRLASMTFVGGSLVNKGGHTPFEPMAYDNAVLHGPYLDNFLEIYAQLQAANATCAVGDSHALTEALLWLRSENARTKLVTAARQCDLGHDTGQSVIQGVIRACA